MNLLPSEHEEFSRKEYWDYLYEGSKGFEWYGEYRELGGLLNKYVKTNDTILMIGCGTSTLSADLYDDGYRNISNIDISHVVVEQMHELHGCKRPEMTFETMDALATTYNDAHFSVVLDKGTLDALMPDDSQESQERTTKLFNEIDRVLRLGGRYVCVSLLEKHILHKLLDHFSSAGWMVRFCRCLASERKAALDPNIKFNSPVFVVVCTKIKKLVNVTPVLEVSSDGTKVERLSTTINVVESIRSMQQSAIICGKLRREKVSSGGEVKLDLYKPDNPAPRYTVHVLDQPSVHKGRRFAAFIVPQGRETEWLFSSPEGRITLLKSAGYARIAVVSLHRDHEFASLHAVQTELSESMRSLAPAGMRPDANIPYLSVGDDVGKREICHKGSSDLSGPYVVEEVEVDGGYLSRRLIFLKNQAVVQSEARLKILKSRKGNDRKVVDVGFLCCEHHTYMVAGVAMVAPYDAECTVAVIGLGGGGLCTFLQHCFNKITVTAVDVDPSMLEVASRFFDLVQDERLVVYIRDGIQFLSQALEKDCTYHAVLLDVNSGDESLGMSCPPPEFLEPKFLNDVKKLLNQKGVLVVNLVCRSLEIRVEAIKKLRDVFPNVCSYNLKQDVNEVVFCSELNLDRVTLRVAAEKANIIAKKKKLNTENLIDVESLIASIEIAT